MHRKYMLLLAADVNTGGESSTSPDVKVADSSSAEQDVNETTEAETETVEETAEGEESSTEAETVEQTTEEQTTETEEKKTEEAIPYERFNEVNTKKVELESRLEADKPLVEQARVTNEFLRDNQITPQEYQSALQYLSLLRKDPAQAYAMLKPTYDQLALMQGERLPADLQAEVAAGTLAQERAVELTKARATTQYQQWRQQQGQQGQQDMAIQQVSSTIQSWAQTKQSIDPDFKPGTSLWEQVDLRIKSAPAFRNAAEAQAGSEKAYTDAKAFLGKFAPRVVTPVKKAPVSRANAGNNSVVMKTADDVMNAIKNGIRPNQMKYS